MSHPGPPTAEGLLVVDKPGGRSSHDVVARVRRLAGTRRVGHAGTLDPMATGVLVLGLGRATRLLGHVAGTDKEYVATIRLGVRTSTDDAEGEVLECRDAAGVSAELLLPALRALTGDLLQVPSSVSAIKIGGVRAYARVRAGEEVVLAPRAVHVGALDLLARRETGDPGNVRVELDVHVTCSTGTYVRALARDLGEALGVGGSLAALRRTRVGPFPLSGAVALGDVLPPVLPLGASVAACFPSRQARPEEVEALRHGRPLPQSGLPGPVGVFDGESVLAVVRDIDGAARPLVVLAPA